MAHGNARLTPAGRLTMCERIASGRPIAHVAAEMGVSRATATKWWRRFLAFGVAGLHDRSSRPKRSPRLVSRRIEARIEQLRRREKLGPKRIGYRLGMPASTVHRVLRRLGLHRLAWLDRPTGRIIRRYECAHPGELVHVDVKKLGQIRPGGGWRMLGREAPVARANNSLGKKRDGSGRAGYDYVHSAVDDHTRLAYSEVLADEKGQTCADFLRRAGAFYASHGISMSAVMTDNAKNYTLAKVFHEALAELGARHVLIPPFRPQVNGKVERYNRTLLDEWAYVRLFTSSARRTAALDKWVHTYNHHRAHTALGGLAPIDRVNNLAGHYS
jgi:transposase InsO family protein